MNKRSVFFTICVLLNVGFSFAQKNSNIKFGKITAADFNLSASTFDSGAHAVILADIGTVRFEGNNAGFFTLIFTHYMRVKIVTKNGFEIGSQEIPLFHNTQGEVEKLFAVKGSTYNLENGLITETKLDEKSIFTEKYNDDFDQKKFSMPALKEGSIFELEYTVKSPFDSRLTPWSFQGIYPRLWSEFVVTIPPPLHYMVRMQGDNHFFIDTTKALYQNYAIRQSNGTQSDDSYNVSGSSIYRRWVKTDVPGLHEEPFTAAIENYYARVTFQLNYIQWSAEAPRHDYMSTWNTSAKALLEDKDFGLALSHDNNWMSDELNEIIKGSNSDEEKIRRIYAFVRDNFDVVGKQGYSKNGLYTQNTLKEAFKKRQGNVAEINLLLIAMLRKAGITADPAILSSREHGIANAGYPLLAEYNYVICIVITGGSKLITLDASEPYNGFGQLPENCYNGYAHIMNEEKPIPVYFSSDSLVEKTVTTVFIIDDEKDKLTGSLNSIRGRNESYRIRKEILGSSEKIYEKKVQTAKGNDFILQDMRFDSLKKYDFPLTVHYDFDLKNVANADIIYFNPMLGEGYQNNPFKSMHRLYPVDMPHEIDDTYILSIEIPKGYAVDEMPKSTRVNYNDTEGMFEYIIQKSANSLQMRVRIVLQKTFFPVDEYDVLRDFFAFVVKKENEQIVFKKIK